MEQTDKNANDQTKMLQQILFQNKKLKLVLEILKHSNLKNYYVGAGAINQTVFNYYHGFDLEYGITDFDIVYYDEDTSYEKENKIIKEIKELVKDININVDIKNEARVHLWYKDKFGSEIEPYKSLEDAVSKWGITITCVGVRLEDKLVVFAPYGLNDIFNMIIRPIKKDISEERYLIKSSKWINKWPRLKVVNWND